jgi:hypothetical protein
LLWKRASMPLSRARKGSENANTQKPEAAPAKAAAPAAPPPPPPLPHPSLGEAGLARAPDGAYLVQDSFAFKGAIGRSMGDRDEELVSALQDAWSDPHAFRALLQPTRQPVAGAASGFEAGLKDSVVRLLLQCDQLQTALAQGLLQSLPEHEAELDGAATRSGMPLPKLVLSQFRWLDHVVDGDGTCLSSRPSHPAPSTRPSSSHLLSRHKLRR